MEKDNKIILGAVLILLVSMLSFNFNGITGKQIGGLPDLAADAYFVDLKTGEILDAVYIGSEADIIVKIKNDGLGDASPGDKVDKVKHRFEMKVNGLKTENRALKKTFTLGNTLKPQDYITKKLVQITTLQTYKFNAVGEHCIDIKVDTGQKLAELNEDNSFLNLGCVTVYEQGKELPKKEETTTTKTKKIKEAPPTTLHLELLEYYINEEKEYVEVLLDEEDCSLTGSFGISCSFKAYLKGPSEEAHDGSGWTNYVVRASTSVGGGAQQRNINSWKVRHVRIVDASNKEFLKKPCGTYGCEMKTGDMLKTDTKVNQFIKPGEYTIESMAELSIDLV